jgi:RNA recognition motif-containing protein
MAVRSIESEQRKLMAKLFVGNLAFSMTDDSLLQLFTGKGYNVGSARIITDRETGRSRGFGFVELAPGDDAAKAIGELNVPRYRRPCASGQRSSSASLWWRW